MLTTREAEVLTHVADGLSDKAIAAELGISHKTVGAHLQSVYRKLRCANRTAAAVIFKQDMPIPTRETSRGQ